MKELRVLGSLDLRGSQGEMLLSVLAQPKRVALLTFLAVAGPHGFHRRDRLLGFFWAERDQEHARAALRTALHFLRQSLGEDVLLGRGDEEVGLAEGLLWCDAVAFQAALNAGELEKALELYRGDLLEGFYISGAPEFEKWLEVERSRLRERAAEAAWGLAAAEEGKGNGVEAAHWARRAAAFTPDDEAAVRRLVELLDRAGDRAGAVKEYEVYVRRLADEYELEPSAEMQTVISSMREREVASRSGREEQAGVTVPQLRALVAGPGSEPELRGEHRGQPRRLAQAAIGGYYGLISLAVLGAVHTFTLQLGLPGWFFWGTLLVLVGYLPIVLATALVQGPPATTGVARERGIRGVLTWRNVVSVGVVLIALWGLVPAGWLLFVGGLAPEIRRIAVLPAQSLPADPDQEYFADGMTDQLINTLGKIEALEVISRSSVMRYKGTGKSVPEIARELEVDAVVELSVYRVEDRVRITAQLIDAAADRHLWAQTYERGLRDVLALQNEVAQAIAGEIQISLTPAERAAMARARPVDPQAQDAYLRGRFFANPLTPAAQDKGIAYLRQAIELDPQDPRPYAALAEAYCLVGMGSGDWLPRQAAFEQAEEAALKAIELDEGLAGSHAVLGLVKFLRDWDWQGAERELRRAIRANPSCAFSHWGYAQYLEAMGRLDEAIAENRRAQELDPLSPIITVGLALRYYVAGQHDRALAEARRALELTPDYVAALWVVGMAYERKGMYEEAIAAHRRAVEVNSAYSVVLAVTYAAAGRPGEARKILVDLDEQAKRRDALFVAQAHAALDERDRAFEWLEAAYQERDLWITWLRLAPHFEGLRRDPRYRNLLRRMNFLD